MVPKGPRDIIAASVQITACLEQGSQYRYPQYKSTIFVYGADNNWKQKSLSISPTHVYYFL